MNTLAIEREQTLENRSYTTTFTVAETPEQVFNAISNVRAWWSEDVDGVQIDSDLCSSTAQGRSSRHIQNHGIRTGEKIVWHVLQNYFKFVEDTTEWTGTDIVFDSQGRATRQSFAFTHVDLKPSEECYSVCRDAWGFLSSARACTI
jgi:regulatory protein YycH of two-component signal transduction system YycFG